MGNVVASPDLLFLHLSDIHFRGGRTNDVHDEDRELRNELLRDLRRLRSALPRVDGLFVSGDVAFAGKPEEYEIAANWIDSIQEAVACPREGIMVTPGNHDVDRDQVPDGGELATLQDRIRKGSSLAERDSALAQVLRHPTDGAQLFASMSAYMQFAERYGCSVSPTLPYWERAFKLRDGSILKFRGLTTTLLSGPHDDDQTHKMFYGSAQRIILRDDKVRHVVVGHHPRRGASKVMTLSAS